MKIHHRPDKIPPTLTADEASRISFNHGGYCKQCGLLHYGTDDRNIVDGSCKFCIDGEVLPVFEAVKVGLVKIG